MITEISLLKTEGPEIYVYDNKKIRHISNLEVFKSLGLHLLNIKKISEEKIKAIPEGNPINTWNDLESELKLIIKKHLENNNLYVDIVIVNYNSLDYLKNCIQSIYQNTKYPYNIIIVDNNSTDGSIDFLKKIQTENRLEIILNNHNRGCASGWNQGIKKGKGRYIVLLNPDTKVTLNWLYPLVKIANRNQNIAVIGTKHVNAEEKVIHAGVIKNNNKLINRKAKKDGPGVYDKPMEIEAIFGACFMIKRDLLPVAGYFDERYFLYAEESDYCLTAKQMGFKIYYCPVKIYHYERGSRLDPNIRNRFHKKSIELLNAKWGEEIYH